MTTLLLSFCNQLSSPRLCLALLDLGTGRFDWVDPKLDIEISGATGVLVQKDRIWVLFQSEAGASIASYTRSDFRLEAVHRFCSVRDAHSICRRDGDLYVTSTGTNEVYRLRTDGPVVAEEVLHWRSPACRSVERDEVHVNSISVARDHLIVTSFGPRVGDSWGPTGTVADIDANEVLLDGLTWPHNGGLVDGLGYSCETGTGKLVFSDGKAIDLGGYPRGVAFTDEAIFVGSSAPRVRSRSRGTVDLSRIDPEGSTGSCLHVLGRAGRAILRQLPLAGYGREVYDLALLEPAPEPAVNETHPLEKRVWNLEAQFYRQLERLEHTSVHAKEVLAQKEALEKEIRQLRAVVAEKIEVIRSQEGETLSLQHGRSTEGALPTLRSCFHLLPLGERPRRLLKGAFYAVYGRLFPWSLKVQIYHESLKLRKRRGSLARRPGRGSP